MKLKALFAGAILAMSTSAIAGYQTTITVDNVYSNAQAVNKASTYAGGAQVSHCWKADPIIPIYNCVVYVR